MALSILGRDGDGDPIDAQLSRLGVAPAPENAPASWHARLGLGWSSGGWLILLLIGAALGPSGLEVLTPRVLSAIDPAVPVALAALGVHVAMQAELVSPALGTRRLAAAALAALVTALVVSGGLLWLLAGSLREAPVHAWLIALSGGVAAGLSLSSMAAPASESGDGNGGRYLEAVPALLLGALLLTWVREGEWADALRTLAASTMLPILVAAAAWLLMTRQASEVEGRIFSLAALLLVGGLADYLSLSALYGGMVAGFFWRATAGQVSEAVVRDVGYMRHPLTVFLFIVAGARTTASADAPVLLAYALLAITGCLAGRLVIQRLESTESRRRDAGGFGSGSRPLAGVLPVAFTLSVTRASGSQAELLLATIAVGTLLLLLFAALVFRRERVA